MVLGLGAQRAGSERPCPPGDSLSMPLVRERSLMVRRPLEGGLPAVRRACRQERPRWRECDEGI